MELKFNTAQVSKERRMSKYFGSEEAQSPATPKFRSSLEFDDQGVENIAKLVFKGLKGGQNKSDTVSKQ